MGSTEKYYLVSALPLVHVPLRPAAFVVALWNAVLFGITGLLISENHPIAAGHEALSAGIGLGVTTFLVVWFGLLIKSSAIISLWEELLSWGIMVFYSLMFHFYLLHRFCGVMPDCHEFRKQGVQLCDVEEPMAHIDCMGMLNLLSACFCFYLYLIIAGLQNEDAGCGISPSPRVQPTVKSEPEPEPPRAELEPPQPQAEELRIEDLDAISTAEPHMLIIKEEWVNQDGDVPGPSTYQEPAVVLSVHDLR